MTPRLARWKYWPALGLLAALSATLAVAWRVDHRAQSEKLRAFESRIKTLSSQLSEVRALESRLKSLSSQESAEWLRTQNDDLIRFIDESYSLLYEAGFHIQLDLKVEEDGRVRISADSAKLTEDLRAKLRELNRPFESVPANR